MCEPSLSKLPLGALHEHPAMAFQIFCAIKATIRRIFRRRENSRAGPLCALKMGVNMIDIHEHPINGPWHRQPFANMLVSLATGCWALVTGGPTREHNDALIGFHLRVLDSPIAFRYAYAFTEPEHPRQPIQRRDTVLVRQHRNDARILVSHDLSLSLRTSRGQAASSLTIEALV